MARQPAWRMFEREVGLLVTAFGYEVEVTPASNDFGADVVALKNGRRVAIQCKLYEAGSIGHAAIISLSGAKGYYGADEAMCIATTKFTKRAIEAARRLSIHLVDRERLVHLCREVSFTLPTLTCLDVGGQYFPLNLEGQVEVGRDTTCRLRLPSERVSRRHARIIRHGGKLTVEDVGSTNGTTLNGRPLAGVRPLYYGDVLDFAGVQATVVLRRAEHWSGKS